MINNLKRHKLTEAILKFSFSMLFFISFTASAHQYKEIADLIEQRLSYMKYVARYTFEKHLPVEDFIQENKVILNSINKAEALSLDKKSIEPFMISQINVAKAIQYCYKADWLSMLKNGQLNADLSNIRLKISKLSDSILQLITEELKNNGQIKNQICLYINKIDQHNLKGSDKKNNLFIT